MHYYGKDGVFVDAYDVHVPSRIAEAKEAVFAFTDRHKKALKVAGTTLSITVAVGSLIVYGKRKSGK